MITEGQLQRRNKGSYLGIFGFVLLALTTISCMSPPRAESEYYGAQIGIVNHTDRYIYSSSVGDGGGGHSDAYSAGVANICCVRVPENWSPGLQFLVRWDMPVNGKHIIKEKMVEVEKYDEPGSLYMHFFPDDQVRLVVSKWVGYSNKHPIPPPPEELYENLKKLKK